MKRFSWLGLFVVFGLSSAFAQQSPAVISSVTANAAVPMLVNFSGTLTDINGKPLAGTVGVTFSFYKEEHGGAPLWLETQNVPVDASGHYEAMLGVTKPDGLPVDLFSSGEARWLEVRADGGEERPRILLLSVPYALKAADAQTLGGLPFSAFVLAAPPSSGVPNSAGGASAGSFTNQASSSVTTTGGVVNTLPLWTTGTNIQSSVLTQTGSGSTARIGINTSTPTATLDVKGGITERGLLYMSAKTAATAAAGSNSEPIDFAASSFSSSTSTAVAQTFQWVAEPVANNTASPSGTLNLLFGLGVASPSETGLKISNKGVFTFAPGQTFPGTGSGTVKSVSLTAPTSDFNISGSPVTGTGTLALTWKVAPTSAKTANAIVERNASGGFSAGAISATQLTTSGNISTASLTASGPITASAMGLGTVSPTERLDLGNDGNVVISTDPGNDTTADLVGYNLIGRGTGGVPNKWSIYTTAVGGGFGVRPNSFSIWQYPPNQDPGCCLERFAILPAYSNTNGFEGLGSVVIDSNGALTATSGTILPAINAFGSKPQAGGVEAEVTGIEANAIAGFGEGSTTVGIYGLAPVDGVSNAGYFAGDVSITGNVSKGGGSFKIDHPLDPANKYLYHSFVESPDMKNVYDGMVTTDAQGDATIYLPDWFEALNRDFRYQLTVIGQFSQAIVASEINGAQFSIKTDKPSVKVSWQVTGIRHDAWANAHRIPIEEAKPDRERGFYLHPELFGAPEEKGMEWARHPQLMKGIKERREKRSAAAHPIVPPVTSAP